MANQTEEATQVVNPILGKRLSLLKKVISDRGVGKKIETAFTEAKGNLSGTLSKLKEANVGDDKLKKIEFVSKLAEITTDNTPLVKKMLEDKELNNLKDIALKHNAKSLEKLINVNDIPDEVKEKYEKDTEVNYAKSIDNKIYNKEPGTRLRQMALKKELPFKNKKTQDNIGVFFKNVSDFDIRTTSIYKAIKEKDAFKDIADKDQEETINELKVFQRIQAISPTPDSVGVLLSTNLKSAAQVVEMPEKQFVKYYNKKAGINGNSAATDNTAKQAYTLAVNNKIRNEQALMSIREAVAGVQPAAIMEGTRISKQVKFINANFAENNIPLNWEDLFGSVDLCECDECNSVLSPAAYFVELLQYLRNNNLDPYEEGDQAIKTDPKDISGTPLVSLFKRRPDLGCLELTCPNTNTVLPYVDLVNEVMESYIVHLGEHIFEEGKLKRARLDTFNITDEVSSELKAQPQNTNYQAYCILKNAKYPFTLPYHQPVDAQRIFLDYLETSRYELLDTFRSKPDIDPEHPKYNDLVSLHNVALDRAADAEYLGLIHEEYIMLTKEAYWQKEFFDIKCDKIHSPEEYREKIGLEGVHKYFGYESEGDMLSADELDQLGLTFIKNQFLKRTGILYKDLVDIVKTRYINPDYPKGASLKIFNSLRLSYRFMQTLVDYSSDDPKVRFGKLIPLLETWQTIIPLYEELIEASICHPVKLDICIQKKDLKQWVYCCFEKLGKLIVLETADNYYLQKTDGNEEKVGIIDVNVVYDLKGDLIGNISEDGLITDKDGNTFLLQFGVEELNISDYYGTLVASIRRDNKMWNLLGKEIKFLPQTDSCDLDRARIKHLDGTELEPEEYDKFHRFIRLWRRLDWSIDETDKAITGLAAYPIEPVDEMFAPDDCSSPRFTETDCEGECDEKEEEFDCRQEKQNQVKFEITPDFLHQLVAVKKLLEKTGLELIKLLTFWTEISTIGDKSLYKRLFLTHNLLSIDPVFKANKNGNYLTKSAKIEEHLPVLMAALNLKSEEILCLIKYLEIEELTVQNVTKIYRYRLLAKVLGVKIPKLLEVEELFGDLFHTAHNTHNFIEDWEKLENSGLEFRQLNYIISDKDDKDKQLQPDKKDLLFVAKTLYDGLNNIHTEHHDISDDEIDIELIRLKSSLLFDPETTERIIQLLQGTTTYTTNAPKNLVISVEEFNSKLSDSLKSRLNYDFIQGGIQVTGILTDVEETRAKDLFEPEEWEKAFDRVRKQGLVFFNDVLSSIFNNLVEAKQVLLQGDVNIPLEQQEPENPVENTEPTKKEYFLKHFIPFLRDRLCHQFILDTLSNSLGGDRELIDLLITTILHEGDPQKKLIEIFKEIITKSPPEEVGWKGYLIPQAEDDYIFSITSDNQPEPLSIDQQEISFNQQEDPTNIWLSEPVHLMAGKVYSFEAKGLSSDLSNLLWKTLLTAKSPIPDTVLLPYYSSSHAEKAYIKLQKSVLLLTGLNFIADEINYIDAYKSDFGDINFNQITLNHWKRLEAFSRLQRSLPATEYRLIDFLKWINQTGDDAQLVEKIAGITNWDTDSINKFISKDHIDLDSPEFRNEINLLKLQHAVYIAEKINMDVDKLFEWARPETKFWECHEIAENIRKSLKARYEQEDWEKVVKPLNDKLRINQRNALINYLLIQQALVDWGVVDADSLFEFFLIDVQMESCMETSRIKQAISSVQLFIQRCMLGEEEKRNGVEKNVLDRDRWEWMQRHRVWEANRKVFLFPENWIEPELRDDKSPFFKELESELLQKDINKETVIDALKAYLYKVDEVANMQVVGLYVEEETQKDETVSTHLKLHVFSRTRNAPYFFFYRYYDIQEKNWYPWEKMQVDIPCYDVEDDEGKITGNGCYLIPIVWNKRLFAFFPQFMKKTKPNPLSQSGSFRALGDSETGIENSKPLEFWEIKLSWSEYRNGKWTQKQISKNALNSSSEPKPDLNAFLFMPSLSDSDQLLIIAFEGTWHYGCGIFEFTGNDINVSDNNFNLMGSFPEDFHYYSDSTSIYSLQTSVLPGALSILMEMYDYSFRLINNEDTEFLRTDLPPRDFHHTFSKEIVGLVSSGSIDRFFEYNLGVVNKTEAYGGVDADGVTIYSELKMPYSIYNWELFLHTPTTLANNLSKSQEFEGAMNWFHYVFNPYAEREHEKEIWQFFPFRETTADNYLQNIFNSLQPNQPNAEITEWRDKPFNPHVVARSRPVAYMKWVVMKYLDNLMEWGDYLYRQYTIETLNQATQLYILASHILGQKPQIIPKRGKIKPQSYLSLLDKWDAFGNAMDEMEIVFPYSNQTSYPIGISNGNVGFANVFGFASTLYFCIPNNSNLLEYWNTVETRLDNIRHCRTIEGVFKIPALWDPPIDPAMLVRATAQGLSLSSVLSDLNSSMPNYRFTYLIQKALELCNEVKSLGNSLLSVLEKKDAEAISKLRAQHETGIQNLMMEIKKKQVDEASQALQNLEYSRKSPVHRLSYYMQLIGEDINNIPGNDADFTEIANAIESPKSVKGLKLSAFEKEEMDKASAAADWQIAIGVTEATASILHALGNMSIEGEPLGVGGTWKFGPSFFAYAAQAVARGMQTYSSELSYKSSSASRKGGFQRQLQDRIFQANSAGYEIKNIDKQILAQNIRIEMANLEITNQQKQINNANEVEEFIKNKYTNEELYSWMLGSVKTLYYQVYKMAYDIAKKAEKVYQFERGIDSSNIIQFGYWDASRDGLYAGEQLYVGIKQLEAAYQEKRGHDYEVTKNISLRQLNPMALLELRETGKCEFAIPEVLFDMDYPGHYMRRIKSVALSIPCVTSPYTSISSTLRLLEHKYRINSVATNKNDYKERIEETVDERFRTINIPITAIAASTGQNDSGVFELNFRDERFMPFEGAGVISKWRIELPKEFRQFDYDTITDIVMQIRYTSAEGGERLKKAAVDSLLDYIKSTEELSQQEGLFAIFDLKCDFSAEWNKFNKPVPEGEERSLTLANLNERLPIFTKNWELDKIKANDVILYTESEIQAASFTLKRDGADNNFTDGVKAGKLNSIIIRDADISIDNWELKISDKDIVFYKIWMVVRYVLK